MKLGEKIRYLREVEGSLRGLDRDLSQQETVRAIEAETGSKLSQSYLSQIESGARPHLTNTTRQILATFSRSTPATWWTTRRATTPNCRASCATWKTSSTCGW
jgi:transcriptional regulator with XRE-family HTH domain